MSSNERQDNLLSVQNLTKTYLSTKGRIDAIVDVTFEVNKSEFLCIIGPSGCGKSTLLYMIGGIGKPTSGRVMLMGKLLRGPSPDIGFVFQKYAAFPWMTVEQNIDYGPRMRGLDKRERRAIVDKYLELVGLKSFAHLYPKELSGGMSKRVDLARTYANNPSILLMDEPFGSLDDFTKKKMQEELLRIWNREKNTIIFVTHDLEEALFLADRIIIMQRHRNTVKTSVKVNFDRPRETSLRVAKEFIEFKKYLIEVMANDIGEDTASNMA